MKTEELIKAYDDGLPGVPRSAGQANALHTAMPWSGARRKMGQRARHDAIHRSAAAERACASQV